jgi:hypothetical protein
VKKYIFVVLIFMASLVMTIESSDEESAPKIKQEAPKKSDGEDEDLVMVGREGEDVLF